MARRLSVDHPGPSQAASPIDGARLQRYEHFWRSTFLLLLLGYFANVRTLSTLLLPSSSIRMFSLIKHLNSWDRIPILPSLFIHSLSPPLINKTIELISRPQPFFCWFCPTTKRSDLLLFNNQPPKTIGCCWDSTWSKDVDLSALANRQFQSSRGSLVLSWRVID